MKKIFLILLLFINISYAQKFDSVALSIINYATENNNTKKNLILDLKNIQKTKTKSEIKPQILNDKKYENIIYNLKELGIKDDSINSTILYLNTFDKEKLFDAGAYDPNNLFAMFEILSLVSSDKNGFSRLIDLYNDVFDKGNAKIILCTVAVNLNDPTIMAKLNSSIKKNSFEYYYSNYFLKRDYNNLKNINLLLKNNEKKLSDEECRLLVLSFINKSIEENKITENLFMFPNIYNYLTYEDRLNLFDAFCTLYYINLDNINDKDKNQYIMLLNVFSDMLLKENKYDN